MPRIFDNIDERLLPALKEALKGSDRADFCVGYFRLRGWRKIDEHIEKWSGVDGKTCRLLVGMMGKSWDRKTIEQFDLAYTDDPIDNERALDERRSLAEEFRRQLSSSIPKDEDEQGLRRLARQIRAKKVVVKLFLGHRLHAKLYLLHRSDNINPKVGFVGSSNLTFAGLSDQGELNVDVMDRDACEKLARWFEKRWQDRWCIDISEELATIIEDSWAGEATRHPYHIYLKIAYHLSREAREGQSDFHIPSIFGNTLFDFQASAVKIAAHHLNKRGGVMIGDVVGLGKTIMASALLKISEDAGGSSLIICPKNLVSMWKHYVKKYDLLAQVVSLSRVDKELPTMKRHRTVLIDESHNLRNREGKRYKVIADYIKVNDSRCVLLSATPYNKSLSDLSSQLRLFLEDDRDIGIRPEAQIRHDGGEANFISRRQSNLRSISAFEKSEQIDDWRELMRRFMVRRTRGFIMRNYAKNDPDNGNKYILLDDGTRSYFPLRRPKTIKFKIDEKDPNDLYARAYSREVLSAIEGLSLPRYGLGNYVASDQQSTPEEKKIIGGLNRAGGRLTGFCRTGLFKRLESGGPAFILSIKRHVMRNLVVLHAIESGCPIPIGSQDADLLYMSGNEDIDEGENGETTESPLESEDVALLETADVLRKRAASIYESYDKSSGHRFKWLKPDLFVPNLAKHLTDDVKNLQRVLSICGEWSDEKDNKLRELKKLLQEKRDEKVLIFTQFADTANHLEKVLQKEGFDRVAAVTGSSDNPTELAWRFSPRSNDKMSNAKKKGEIDVMIATDVLSEGQNLQDCSIIVNFDLPWAIIRLIQRAGRVDRIGQKADAIHCYSFLPAEGIEKIIQLRGRVRERLEQNREVVGSDEIFFEGDNQKNSLEDLYSEKSGILDDKEDEDVDIVSYAYQIWKNAIKADPKIEKAIEGLPDVAYATKEIGGSEKHRQEALVYIKTPDDVDALAQVGSEGQIITQSPKAILDAAECEPNEKALEKADGHHEIVKKAVAHLMKKGEATDGTLGRRSGARFKAYIRLKQISEKLRNEHSLFLTDEIVRDIERAMSDIYHYPLLQDAADSISRQIKFGASDEDFSKMVVRFRAHGRLSMIQDKDAARPDTRILCSMGLRSLT